MSGHDDDRRMRDLFAALREEDRRALPSFDRMTVRGAGPLRTLVAPRTRERARMARPIWATAAILAVALAVAVFLNDSRRPSGQDRFADALALAESMDAWEAPTDSVLEISLLRIPDSVPSLELTSVPIPAEDSEATESVPEPAPNGDTDAGGAPKSEAPQSPLL